MTDFLTALQRVWTGGHRTRWMHPVLMVGLTLASALPAAGQRDVDPSPHSDLALVSDRASIAAGQPFTVALRMTLDTGWHTYWLNAGDAGLPLQIQWDLPEGFRAGPLDWPVPELIPTPPFMSYGYEDEVLALATITPPASLPQGRPITIGGRADWLVCADVCIPAAGEVSLSLRVSAGTAEVEARWTSAVATTRDRLPRAADGWRTRAWAVDSAYVLEVEPPTGTRFVAPYLFADSGGVVEHALPQRVARAGAGVWRIRLAMPDYAEEAASRIGGLLVADVGAGRTSPGWMIEAAVEPAPSDDAAERSTVFLTGDVQETGGFTSSGPEFQPEAARVASSVPGFLIALAFAFLGGLILNLMPCVFPVLSVKVMTLVHDAGASRVGRMRHGLLFAAGVVVSFWALAGLLFGLRAAGSSLGWGFHLQSPAVVAILTLMFFALALGMSGVIEVGSALTRLGGTRSSRSDVDALLTGGLTVLVAAPCTAPFMGAALGYALVQPPALGLAVFTALGVGLAAPYSVLAATPALLSRLPRPGAWMETLKEALAFPLYATVVWLVWVFGRQVGMNAAAVLLLAITTTGFAAWLAGRAAGASRRGLRVATTAVGSLAVILSLWASRSATPSPSATSGNGRSSLETPAWEPFSTERVSELRGEGRTVFVNFTAAWCLSCQVNDRVALHTRSVTRAFEEADVALLKADWTSRDPVIADALQSFGRSGVPLYVVYPPDPSSQPEMLPALLTPGIVIEAIGRAEALRTARR